MIGAAGLDAEQVVSWLGEAGPGVGVNFLVPFLDLVAFEAAAAAAPLVECFYSDPDADLVSRAHDLGALVAWQVGSRSEAMAAIDAGCDVVVVQGVEAGGHIRGREPLRALLDAARAVSSAPRSSPPAAGG